MKHRRGTTLLELIIAIGVIITGLLAVVGLIARSISVGSVSKNEMIALGLAQEGIEAIRSIRDNNVYQIQAGDTTRTWHSGLETAAVYTPGVSNPDNPAITNFFDFAGAPVFTPPDTQAASASKLINSPWSIDFNVNSINDAGAVVKRRKDTNLFFQGLTPPGVQATATPFSRYVTLEPSHDWSGTVYPLSATALGNGCGGCSFKVNNNGNYDSVLPRVAVHIISIVQWKESSAVSRGTHTVTLSEYIYDWR